MSDVGDARLPTGLWVRAKLRVLAAEGTPATVVHRGGETGGTVCLKLFLGRAEGCRVLVQVRAPDGRLGWMTATREPVMPESEADAYVERAVARDPDLWVVEIERSDGTHPFEGPELGR